MELTGRDRWRATVSGRRPPGFGVDTPAVGGRDFGACGGRQLIAKPLARPGKGTAGLLRDEI